MLFFITNPDQILYSKEEMVGSPYEADKMYGWAKLIKTFKEARVHEVLGDILSIKSLK